MLIKEILYLSSAILFILSLRNLSAIKTAKFGNICAISGMIIAIITTIYGQFNYKLIVILITILAGGSVGYGIAKKINMKDLPQLIAAFHSLIGLAALAIDSSIFFSPEIFGTHNPIPVALGITIGAITFTGSVAAFCKLQGIKVRGIIKVGKNHNILLSVILLISILYFAISPNFASFLLLLTITLILGWFLIVPIGGADMPVIISMLNSYSGWAASGIGLTLNNRLLIIVGALVGTSGAILSHIMCKGMNRSLLNVIFGSFSKQTQNASKSQKEEQKPVKLCQAEDVGYLLNNAQNVIIVPGYGMAVSQAQHGLKELFAKLINNGVNVKFAIHPVAGRMPGHMNVLLAEANISDDYVFDLEEINSEFSSADVVLVVGANDITNPAANDDPTSSIYGMPILEVWKAKTVIVLKRSLNPGYAGIDNPLFYRNNTLMLLGDAKKSLNELGKM